MPKNKLPVPPQDITKYIIAAFDQMEYVGKCDPSVSAGVCIAMVAEWFYLVTHKGIALENRNEILLKLRQKIIQIGIRQQKIQGIEYNNTVELAKELTSTLSMLGIKVSYKGHLEAIPSTLGQALGSWDGRNEYLYLSMKGVAKGKSAGHAIGIYTGPFQDCSAYLFDPNLGIMQTGIRHISVLLEQLFLYYKNNNFDIKNIYAYQLTSSK